MSETLEQRERLYKSIADCKDDYTRRVLYSQFIDTYYQEAFDSILFEFNNNRVQRIKR
jgi:hypothetical protein